MVYEIGRCTPSSILPVKMYHHEKTGIDHDIELQASIQTSPFELTDYQIPETLQACTAKL